jgi:E3 ubiquitin-protein ligase synoviolin
VERITERLHHGIVEICLTLTVFRQDFDARLVILMGILAMVKVFHWLIQDRINYIQTESVITPLQHIRIVSFLSILMVRFACRQNYRLASTTVGCFPIAVH